MTYFERIYSIIKQTIVAWRRNNPMMLAAALSYFTVFSILPLLILSIVITGKIMGETAARAEIFRQIEILFSPQAAESVAVLLESAQASGAKAASVLSAILLVFGASRIFLQVQNALNIIWRSETPVKWGFKTLLKKRFLSMAMIGAFSAFAFSFFLLDGAMQAASVFMARFFPDLQGLHLIRALYFVTSVGLFTVLFAFVFKFAPDVKMAWRDIWVGAFVTSLLFAGGRGLVALYFKFIDVASLYGAAGSLVVVILWIYFTAQIFLLGAEFTWVYSRRLGTKSQGTQGTKDRLKR